MSFVLRILCMMVGHDDPGERTISMHSRRLPSGERRSTVSHYRCCRCTRGVQSTQVEFIPKW